jgi:hypothetical protein
MSPIFPSHQKPKIPGGTASQSGGYGRAFLASESDMDFYASLRPTLFLSA